jgi:hypothetical protein
MLDGVMLLWFLRTAILLLCVVIDIRTTPESSVLKSARKKLLFCFTATVLIFFIAGPLYLLRLERVDNFGAYRIPSETALSSLLFTTMTNWSLRLGGV